MCCQKYIDRYFTVIPPSADNHGPVRVAGTYYLAYEDGTPYQLHWNYLLCMESAERRITETDTENTGRKCV